MASKDVPVPVLRTCENRTLVGKWDFANVIQVEVFEISIPDYTGGPSLLKGEEEVKDAEGGVTQKKSQRVQLFWL